MTAHADLTPRRAHGKASGHLTPTPRRDVYAAAENTMSPAYDRPVATFAARAGRFPMPVSGDATTLDTWPDPPALPTMAEVHRRLDDGLALRGITRGNPPW